MTKLTPEQVEQRIARSKDRLTTFLSRDTPDIILWNELRILSRALDQKNGGRRWRTTRLRDRVRAWFLPIIHPEYFKD